MQSTSADAAEPSVVSLQVGLTPVSAGGLMDLVPKGAL
jgi:hypothetical protein